MKDKSLAQLENDDITIIMYHVNWKIILYEH
jgi:hypothetical protein